MEVVNSPKISIIIPVYNAEKYLRECLESVCSQTYSNFEAIVVNDGSSDSSLSICHEFADCDSRILVFSQENRGVVIARQVAVSESSGNYLLFLDADDYLRKDCLEILTGILNVYNPDVIVYSDYTRINDQIIKNELDYAEGLYDRNRIVNEIYPSIIQTDECRYFPPCVFEKIFKKSLYQKYQLKDGRVMIGEDMACIVPCICNASTMYISGENLYYSRRNPTSVTGSRKAFDWNCAEQIANHLSKTIDLTECDLQMQLYRYVTHMLFTTACSQFNTNAPYGKIKKDIIEHVSQPYYAMAVDKSKFKVFSNGYFAKLALKYKLIWLAKIYEKCLR